MNPQHFVACEIAQCSRIAQKAAILGTQRFCVVPAMSDVKTALPLIRYNLCELHLNDVRSNFEEVYHDASISDYGDLARLV